VDGWFNTVAALLPRKEPWYTLAPKRPGPCGEVILLESGNGPPISQWSSRSPVTTLDELPWCLNLYIV
jgi:hypothetical protein